MAQTNDLTAMAQAGFDASDDDKCPGYDSSPNGMAWLAGRWCRQQGMQRPIRASMSRGYSVNVDDRKVSIKNPQAICLA